MNLKSAALYFIRGREIIYPRKKSIL